MKRFTAILLVLLMVVSSSSGFANSEITNYEEILKQKSLSEPLNKLNGKSTETLSESELESIREAAKIRESEYRKNEREVADLIFEMTKNQNLQYKAINSDKDGRIEVMRFIIEQLKNASRTQLSSTDEMKLLNYVQSYGPYTNDTIILEFLNEKRVDINYSYSTLSTYNRDSAVNYAHNYWDTFNTPTYPNLTSLGGDCANFVSQSLKAGGKSTDSTWFITRKNTTYPTPSNITELNYSWTLSDPSPWISAKEFNNYWSSKASSTFTESGNYVYNNPSVIFSKMYYRGDAVQILKQNFWWYEGYHTMLITGYGSGDFLLSYHSTGTKDKALNTIANSYKGSEWQFKFFGM